MLLFLHLVGFAEMRCPFVPRRGGQWDQALLLTPLGRAQPPWLQLRKPPAAW